MTPHQLHITGWPREYIVSHTRKGRHKVHSILICEKFRQMFHTHDGENFSPCHRYIKLWQDSRGEEKIRVILYFDSLEGKEKTKKLINMNDGLKNIYGDKILNYKLSSRDYSHMCTCNICSKFMPSHAERLQINKRDASIFNSHRHGSRTLISDKDDWNNILCQVPICVECLHSKERQGKYRLNMYDHGDIRYKYVVNSPEERKRNNLEVAAEVEKPDMRNIPHIDKFNYETPFDYSASLNCMLNTFSSFYWHPDLTADEYMRYQEYKMLQYLENADPLDDDDYPEDDYGEYPNEY